MEDEWITETQGALRVHVLPTDKYKIVSVLAQVEWPLTRERVTKAALLPQMLLRGTRNIQTPEGLMRAFDEMYGANLSARSNKHGDVQTLEFTLQLPGEAYISGGEGLFAKALGLLAEVVTDPFVEEGGFPKAAFETEKTLHRQRIDNVVNDKLRYAMERCTEEMFNGVPFGIPRLGYAADLDTMSAGSLFGNYIDMVRGGILHVYVVGSVDPESTVDLVRSAFHQYAACHRQVDAPSPKPQVEANPRAAVAPRVVVDELDVNQGKLNFGLRTGCTFADDDYPALLVYNGILGGFPHSKLFVNVREKASLAYYASSRLEGLKGAVFVQSGIKIDDFDRAKGMIEEQLESMRTGDVTKDELSFTKSGLLNQYLQSDDHPLTGAMLHMFGRFSGRERSITDLIDEIANIALADVARVAADVQLEMVYFLRPKEA